MENAQHTPGPWHIWNSGYAEAPSVIYTGDVAPYLNHRGKLVMAPGSFVAEVSEQRGHMAANEDYIQHDNGHLIAAAPDLLEALEELLECQKFGFNALAKQIERKGKSATAARAAIAKARGQS